MRNPENAAPISLDPETPQADSLLAMMLGAAQTQLIRLMAQLGIADLLKEGPQSAENIANATGAQTLPLLRVLHALARLGLVEEDEAARFRCTQMGALLGREHSGSLRGYAVLFGTEWNFRAWPYLQHGLLSYSSAFEAVFGTDLYTYLRQHPADSAEFQDALTSISAHEAKALLNACDFSAYRTVIDVGGGQGFLLASILRTHPTIRGVLFDLPEVVPNASALISKTIDPSRFQIVGGDFVTEVPSGGDLYILKRVLISLNDAQAQAVLVRCRCAMAQGAHLLVVDPDLGSLYGALFDIAMLQSFGSQNRIRIPEEIADLCRCAGLKPIRRTKAGSVLTLTECVIA
jgi:hypothetical protein